MYTYKKYKSITVLLVILNIVCHLQFIARKKIINETLCYVVNCTYKLFLLLYLS